MENDSNLLYTFKDLSPYITNLSMDTSPDFGELTPHQMIEHIAFMYAMAMGKIPVPLTVSPENSEKLNAFLFSEKDIRPGTGLKFDLPPLRTENINDAITNLKNIIEKFEQYFAENQSKKNPHPIFGLLDYDGWKHFLDKHNRYHLKQFKLIS